MQLRWLFIGVVALYFAGHLLYAYGLLWAALAYVGLSVAVCLMFGACVAVGRGE